MTEMIKRHALVSLVTLLLLATRAAAQTATYSVGPQDVLTISVWDQPNLSGKFSVEADGTFTFPLIGRIKAGGLSLREVESELRSRLDQGFLRNPQVSVAVDQYRSQRVYVVGEVRTAGTYPLTGDMTLIEALARAGSTTDRARYEAVIVRAPAGGTAVGPLLPDEAGASEVLHVDLKELQAGTRGQNVVLRDGDTVFVPRAESVYVSGQVRTPGGYPVQGDTTVLQALSLAGGVTDRGAANRVKIVRTVDGRKQELKAKPDDLVHPGDTVVVPERFF